VDVEVVDSSSLDGDFAVFGGDPHLFSVLVKCHDTRNDLKILRLKLMEVRRGAFRTLWAVDEFP